MNQLFRLSVMIALAGFSASAQFKDDFNAPSMSLDPSGVHGWTFFTGDGSAVMDFSQSEQGYASILVDATQDRRGIWWALIRRRVSENMDLHLLADGRHEFRVETRIRVSSAPKRVNLHLNTQRTTDFHSHLMEFDIADTTHWHTISMTTHHFPAAPGDSVYGQLALMDWGLEHYRVDVDYFKVDIVDADSVGPDLGVQVPYHPPMAAVTTFSCHIPVAQDAVVDREYPDLSFGDWSARGVRVLTVNGTQFVILRWDLSAYRGKRIDGSGVLELTTYSLERSPEYEKDFGMVRITEIIGGNSHWTSQDVTYDRFCGGQPPTRVMNSQMIIDIAVNEKPGGVSAATISNPVLQRMVDGRTLGLAIRPLGAVNASFVAMNNQGGQLGPRLHFNVVSGAQGRRLGDR
jgi:hypothetical protein